MHKFIKLNNIEHDLIIEDKESGDLSIAIKTINEADVNLFIIDKDLNESFLTEPSNGQHTVFGEFGDNDNIIFTTSVVNAIKINKSTGIQAVACYSEDNIGNVYNDYINSGLPIKAVVFIDYKDNLELMSFVADSFDGNEPVMAVRERVCSDSDYSMIKSVNVALDAIKERTEGSKLKFKRVSDLGELKGVDWLIEDMIQKDGLVNIFGPSGHYKSFVVIDMLCCMAAGKPWMGKETQKSGSLYVCGEGEEGINARIKAWQKENDHSEALDVFMTSDLVKLIDDGHYERLLSSIIEMRECVDFPIDTIVFDTLNRCAGDIDENNSRDMTKFTDACIALRKKTGMSVIIVHHTPKSSPRESRGSGSLKGSLEAEINVLRPMSKDGEEYGYVEVNVTKQKNSRECSPMFMTPAIIELGNDRKGKPVTSVVMDYLSPEEANKMYMDIEANSEDPKKVKKSRVNAKKIVDKSKERRTIPEVSEHLSTEEKIVKIKSNNTLESSILDHIKDNGSSIRVESLKSFCEFNEFNMTDTKTIILNLVKAGTVNVENGILTIIY